MAQRDFFSNLALDARYQQEPRDTKPQPHRHNNVKWLIGLGFFALVTTSVVIHRQSPPPLVALLNNLQHADGVHFTAIVTGPLSVNGQEQRIDVYMRNRASKD